VFTRAFHWALSSARSIQPISPHPISLRFILMLSSHLSLGLPSGLYPPGFTTKILTCIHLLPMRAICPAPHPPPDHSNHVWWKVQVMKLLTMQFYPTSYHFIPLRSRYSPQHPFLQHPQSFCTTQV
jgi:hypothetical protein